MIELKLVDESSFQAVLDLKISEADERARFVAPNVRSLADAWLYRENEDVFRGQSIGISKWLAFSCWK